jgi:hypothetical protein
LEGQKLKTEILVEDHARNKRSVTGGNRAILVRGREGKMEIPVENWSPTSLQQRLVKTGGWLVKHARYYLLLLAEGHRGRRLFARMLRMIVALPVPDR